MALKWAVWIHESHLCKSKITLILSTFGSQMGSASPESHLYKIEIALIVFEFDSEMAV